MTRLLNLLNRRWAEFDLVAEWDRRTTVLRQLRIRGAR